MNKSIRRDGLPVRTGAVLGAVGLGTMLLSYGAVAAETVGARSLNAARSPAICYATGAYHMSDHNSATGCRPLASNVVYLTRAYHHSVDFKYADTALAAAQREMAPAWLGYVSQAYNHAIYSYPSPLPESDIAALEGEEIESR